jgi:hypothetical protein
MVGHQGTSGEEEVQQQQHQEEEWHHHNQKTTLGQWENRKDRQPGDLEEEEEDKVDHRRLEELAQLDPRPDLAMCQSAMAQTCSTMISPIPEDQVVNFPSYICSSLILAFSPKQLPHQRAFMSPAIVMRLRRIIW